MNSIRNIKIKSRALTFNGFDKVLQKEIIEQNKSRADIICVVLMFMVIGSTIFELSVFKNVWKQAPEHKNAIISNITILLFFAVYLMISFNKGLSRRNSNILAKAFIIGTLSWCVYLALNSQSFSTQISAYIIACFCMSAIFILSSIEIIILLSSTGFCMICGLLMLQHDFNALAGNVFSVIFTIVLSAIVSRIILKQYVNAYMNRKTITRQKMLLEEAKENLEATVSMRTCELSKANELLMEEISLRQEAEVESVRSRLKYEETSKKLDKSIEYEQSRSNFFANLSHELRTPVNVIYSALQMMELMLNEDRSELNKNTMKKYMKIIKQNCFRLIRLVGNLIDITKIDASHYELNLQNCDIVKIVENITLSVADYIESKRINLIFDTEMEENIIACDPDKIERIMLNLLSNAVKFTNEEGFIYVFIEKKDDSIVITVKDTGVGIPSEKQDSIFERYVQASGGDINRVQGSGIGLSLVKALVEMHGGRVELKSQVCVGSEFIIQLPNKYMKDIQNEIDSGRYSCNNIDTIEIEFSDIYS